MTTRLPALVKPRVKAPGLKTAQPFGLMIVPNLSFPLLFLPFHALPKDILMTDSNLDVGPSIPHSIRVTCILSYVTIVMLHSFL